MLQRIHSLSLTIRMSWRRVGPLALSGSRRVQVCGACAGLVLMSALAHGSGLKQLPRFDDIDLAPDGKHLLMVRAGAQVYDLVVRDLATAQDTTLYEGDLDKGLVNWCRWANEERIVCSVRSSLAAPRIGQITRTRLFAINADGSQFRFLVPKARNLERRPVEYEAQVQDRLVSWLMADRAHVLVQLKREVANRPSVYRLNIYDGSLVRVKRARGKVRRWYASHDGVVRMALGYRNESEPVLYAVEGRRLKAFDAPSFDSELPPQPLGFSTDLQSVYMSMTNGADRHGLYRVSLADRQVQEQLYTDPDFDVFGSLVLDPVTGEPSGVRYLAHHPEIRLFEPTLETVFDRVQTLLPGRRMKLLSADLSFNKLVFYSYGGVMPGYYLYEVSTDALSLIGLDYPAYESATVVDLQPVTYPTRDGLQIPAYLAVPPGPGPHPAVLLPHGGPYARDSAEFDVWTQFLVDRGIAVLKPNYRGSVGYGEAYMQAGYKEWGLKMQQDLLDGLHWMIDQGIALEQRACVVGASYGGYSAMVFAYKYADQIRCAVSLAGISDLVAMVRRLYGFDLVQRNRERIQEGGALKANSPLHQVENVGVPVLLVHGDRDSVVRVRQSRNMAKALAQAGKPHQYVELPGGDHGLSSNAQRTAFLAALESFLEQHLLSGVR